MADDVWVGLADAVTAVRGELEEARARRPAGGLEFEVGAIELELSLDVRYDAKGRVKVSVLPWGAEAEGGRASARTHRLALTLHPLGTDGGPARVSGGAARRPE